MISVIVPVYNTAKYLGECIDSIINQTYKNLEIILVDDGSKDDSLQIMRHYEKRDERVKVYHKDNSGVSGTRNFGLEQATGEYISFCDSDDIMVSKLFETLMECMTKYQVDRVCGGYEYLYPNGRRVYCKPKEEDGLHKKDKLLTTIIDAGVLSGFQYSGVNNSLFKKRIIDEYNISFHEDVRYNEDSLFSFEYAINSGDLYSLRSVPLYLYRQHEESATHKRIAGNKYEELHEYLMNMDIDRNAMQFDIQIRRRSVTEALWEVLDIAKNESGIVAIEKIKKAITADSVRENLQYIDKEKLGKYKKVFYFAMKHKMSVSLYIMSGWIMPVASKYISH